MLDRSMQSQSNSAVDWKVTTGRWLNKGRIEKIHRKKQWERKFTHIRVAFVHEGLVCETWARSIVHDSWILSVDKSLYARKLSGRPATHVDCPCMVETIYLARYDINGEGKDCNHEKKFKRTSLLESEYIYHKEPGVSFQKGERLSRRSE